MAYTPPQEILDRYARVLVDFALGGGSGIKPGEVVRVVGHESAKPLYAAVNRAVWRSGGHVVGQYLPDDAEPENLRRAFFEIASEDQLDFFPARLTRGMIDDLDHQVAIISTADPQALKTVEPRKIMRAGRAMKPLMDWRREKESAGDFTWTLGLYGTPAMAAEAGLSEEEYWQQIIDACFLDDEDPIAPVEGGQRADRRLRRPAGRARDRAAAHRGRGRRPVDLARRAALLDRRERAQHPELRDLHEPRLAGHGGVDPLQPAALPLRQPDLAGSVWSSRAASSSGRAPIATRTSCGRWWRPRTPTRSASSR